MYTRPLPVWDQAPQVEKERANVGQEPAVLQWGTQESKNSEFIPSLLYHCEVIVINILYLMAGKLDFHF